MLRRVVLAVFLMAAPGCSCAGASTLGAQAVAPRASPEPPAPARLVVVVVLDQLGSATLERFLPELAPAGAIRRTIARGRYVHRAVYDYAATYTAPGHAAIYTGAAPFETGIATNRVFDRDRHARVSSVDDGEHAVLGRDRAFASPVRLRVPTVADRLEEATGGRSIVVSLAMKDRSAILPGGRHPDLCAWLDPKAGGFTTSTYYATALPDWLTDWREANPMDDAVRLWSPMDADRWTTLHGADAQHREGAYGWGATFPHDPRVAAEPAEAFLATPASTSHLFSLAERAVDALGMGRDEVPDLLMISVASTDYVGHAFGPHSWEMIEVLSRIDLALASMLARLEEDTSVAVLLTSDHGVAPLVEVSRSEGHADAVRWTSEARVEELRAALALEPGIGAVDAWVQPYVYLGVDALAGDARARTIAAALRWIEAQPGIARAFDTSTAATLRASSDLMERLVGRSIPDPPPGEVYVVPSEWSVALEELSPDAGTSHGSPWAYDREVPVLVSGPGVDHSDIVEAVEQRRVFDVICALLGLEASNPTTSPHGHESAVPLSPAASTIRYPRDSTPPPLARVDPAGLADVRRRARTRARPR